MSVLKKNQATLDHYHTFEECVDGRKLTDEEVKSTLVPAAMNIQSMVKQLEVCKTFVRLGKKGPAF